MDIIESSENLNKSAKSISEQIEEHNNIINEISSTINTNTVGVEKQSIKIQNTIKALKRDGKNLILASLLLILIFLIYFLF